MSVGILVLALVGCVWGQNVYPVDIPPGGRMSVHGWLILPFDHQNTSDISRPIRGWFFHHVSEFPADSPHNFHIMVLGEIWSLPHAGKIVAPLAFPIPPEMPEDLHEWTFTPPPEFSLNDLLSGNLTELQGVVYDGLCLSSCCILFHANNSSQGLLTRTTKESQQTLLTWGSSISPQLFGWILPTKFLSTTIFIIWVTLLSTHNPIEQLHLLWLIFTLRMNSTPPSLIMTKFFKSPSTSTIASALAARLLAHALTHPRPLPLGMAWFLNQGCGGLLLVTRIISGYQSARTLWKWSRRPITIKRLHAILCLCSDNCTACKDLCSMTTVILPPQIKLTGRMS